MEMSRRKFFASLAGAGAGAAALTRLWSGRPPDRQGPSRVRIEVAGGKRVIVSNGLPEHATGDFPSRHDPEPLQAQAHRVEVALEPEAAEAPTPLRYWWFGMAVNGVPFDPSGPSWKGDGDSGWDFEVLEPASAVALGIDTSNAHTQAGGIYHYHGLPTGLLWRLRREQPDGRMLLVGYAADGFPIYGPEAPGSAEDPDSPIRLLRSSYRLRRGARPGGPGGRFDGTFVQDFEFVAGHGDLDECNGRYGPTPECPQGTYHYVLTSGFPFIPRLWRGKPSPSFAHGPPPGASPPVPPELLRYQPIA